ncbi:MFS transporter [Histidinibacterium aquaticum]|uniref:MFS transporter n=1 Tax=Histidinibacterium aquaticum TaxID=2613962 RepID=A0A5J5GMR7_9RHOB|nr:MFS transporter [Histidinibacterium aquaticum]KAA9008983.1 MFS transporter [Histidinibacterium aquaticum]
METRTPFGTVLLLWAAGLGAAAQYGKASVGFGALAEAYPAAGASLGFAVSLVGFIGIILGVVAGLVVGRLRYRRALLWALWAGAALSLFQATLPAMPLLLASRIVEGMSHLAIVVAAPTLISAITAPRHSGFVMTLWGSFFGVAFALLAFLGLPLVDRLGLPALFVAHAIWMAACALLIGAVLSKGTAPRVTEPLDWRGLAARHVEIYRSPWIGAAGVGWLFYTFCFVSLLTLIPPFIAPGWRAAIVGAMPLMSIAVSLTLGTAMLRQVSAVWVVILGFAVGGVSALGLLVAPGGPLFCLLLASGLGLTQGASFALVAELNPDAEDRAAGYGAMAQTGNIGNTIGTPVMVVVIAALGHPGFALGLAAVLFGGAAAHMMLMRLREAAPTGQV